MNNARRKALRSIIEKLQDCHDRLETLKEDENEAFENMPEGLRSSERGEATEMNLETLESSVYDLETMIDLLTEVADQ